MVIWDLDGNMGFGIIWDLDGNMGFGIIWDLNNRIIWDLELTNH